MATGKGTPSWVRHGGALVSLVERKSGYVALLSVPSKHATGVRRAMCGRLQQLPPELRQAMTLDNGSEFDARF